MKVAAVIICTQNWSRRNSPWVPFTLITIISVLAADWSLSSMCLDFGESNSQWARVSAGYNLKFRYNTPSFAMLSTLNNAQNLDPKYLKASFPVKWTLAHESAGKPQCGMIGVPVLRPVETEVNKCSAVILVRLCDHSNRLPLFSFLVKVSFTKFENSSRNKKSVNVPSADARQKSSEYLCKLGKEYLNSLTCK